MYLLNMCPVFGAEMTLYLIPHNLGGRYYFFTEEETEAQGGYIGNGMTGI